MEKNLRILYQLLPSGLAWAKSEGSNLRSLLTGISQEFKRIDAYIKNFIREMNPSETFELLDEFESMLSLPESCGDSDPNARTLAQRRGQIIQKLTDRGSLSESYLEKIAKDLGYEVDIDVYATRPFKVGLSTVGEALTNSPWSFMIIVRVPIGSDVYFRVGSSTVGESLRFVDNEILRCTLLKRKPAHANMFFIFE